MSKYIYLVQYNNEIIGIYLKYKLAKLFILSCLQSNLINNSANILTFEANSYYCIYSNTIKLNDVNIENLPKDKSIQTKLNILKLNSYKNYNISVNDDSNKDDNLSINDKSKNDLLNEILNKKKELQHQLNIIKYNKQKLEDIKTMYNTDLKLYDQFIINIKNNPNFIIPELFQIKFNIIKKLKELNILSYETFYNEIKKYNNDYELFSLNDYETKYTQISDKISEIGDGEENKEFISLYDDINEEFEIDNN